MIGNILTRRADDKGRILISDYKGKEVYLVDLGVGYFITDNKEIAEKVSKNSFKSLEQELLRLLEELEPLSAEEIEKIMRSKVE